ncbi:hypothetical protein PSHT_02123 [Puccinia striiformis]|uniref:Uncharacterized protein n=1 Tax=Puccinia striiformis TaxID=27350 RepID=A0A2S4WIP6_9BASI|nr:hypothetical protein PSHT_02123 [Puccinia striiformis]
MIKEILDHRELYLKLQGGEEELSRIIEGLQVKSKEKKNCSFEVARQNDTQPSHCQRSHQTSSISFHDCLMGPHESPNTTSLYLIHVDDNSWVLATVEAINGVNPIPPPILATKSTSKNTERWLAFIKKGVNLFKTGENPKKI